MHRGEGPDPGRGGCPTEPRLLDRVAQITRVRAVLQRPFLGDPAAISGPHRHDHPSANNHVDTARGTVGSRSTHLTP